VGSPDHWRIFEFPGAASEHVGQALEIAGDQRRCLLNEQCLRGVDNIV